MNYENRKSLHRYHSLRNAKQQHRYGYRKHIRGRYERSQIRT